MKRFLILTILTSAVAVIGLADTASAARRQVVQPLTSWHGWNYHSAWGMPVAMVVPPTAGRQTKWGWGVGNTQVVPINPQFSRDNPGPGQYNPRLYRPTPPWPSHTDQFGVHYIRGPW